MNRGFSADPLRKAPPLPPAPPSPRPAVCRGMEGCRPHPPTGTLPHPLENATRFPQPTGPHDGEGSREDGCTVLIVAAAQE